jgi:hypothetical protein
MNQIKVGKTQEQEEILSRRILLRGALAVGCGMLVPAALFGCGKKEAESTGAAPESTPPPSAGSAMPAPSPEAAAPAASPKVSQASVQYQTGPKGDQQCSGCMHFIPESNTCKLVEGQISPNGWCVLWAKKM